MPLSAAGAGPFIVTAGSGGQRRIDLIPNTKTLRVNRALCLSLFGVWGLVSFPAIQARGSGYVDLKMDSARVCNEGDRI